MPRWMRLAGALAVLGIVTLGAGGLRAHGKEVTIAVTCLAPDPARPLTRVCTAFLRYLDGDPVRDARFELMARRVGKAEPALGPIPFSPLNRDGSYSTTVTFPAYGRWRIRFEVREGGTAAAEVEEELLPPAPGTSPRLEARQRVVLAFGLVDLRNLALRVLHLLAAALWFAAIGVVFVLGRFTAPHERGRSLARMAAPFPWAAGGSLLLVTVTGILNARFNAPGLPPGILAPETIARLPFGKAYLAVFAVKMGLMGVILISTTALALLLRRTSGTVSPPDSSAASAGDGPGPAQAVVRVAAINLVFGLLTLASVVMLGYMHILSHVAAASGAR